MPQRQQTQGDFGIRPVRPQQQLTDTYSAPSLPKPDLSVYEGIAKLSDTGMQIIDFKQKQDAYQQKAGKALGEAQPDYKIGKGSTEAAMVGFLEGRGTALGSMFQQEVESNWKVAVEANENLLDDESSYQIFHDSHMNNFVEQHQIEGITLPKFLEGQDTHRMKKSADHAVSSLKYKRKVFINEGKEVTGSSLALGNQYGMYVDNLTNEQLYEATTDFTTGAEGEHLLQAFSYYMRGDSKAKQGDKTKEEGLEDITGQASFSSTDILRRRSKLKTEYALEGASRIQGMLERANEAGMNTLQEMEGNIIEDFIAELKDGKNPDMAFVVLNDLTTGTAKFIDRPAVQSALLENAEAIDLNMFNRRVSEEQSMDWFSATKITHPEWSDDQWRAVYQDLEAVPIESERIALREKVLLNWERSIAARDSKTSDDGIAVGQAQQLMLTGEYTLDGISAQTGVPKNKLNRMAEAQVLATMPLNVEQGGYNSPEAAKAFMDFVGTQQQFNDATFIKTGAIMNTSAYTATTTNPDVTQIKQGFELYRAMNNANIEDKFDVSPLAKSVYGFILSEERKGEQSLEQIVNRVFYDAALMTPKSSGYTTDEIYDAFEGVLGDGGWFGLSPDVAPSPRNLRVLGDQLQMKVDLGLTVSQATNEIVDEWEKLGIRTVRDNESEDLWQYTEGSDFDYDTFTVLDDYVAETVEDMYNESDAELDPYRTAAIADADKKEKTGTTVNPMTNEEIDVMLSEREIWERDYIAKDMDRQGFGDAGSITDEDYEGPERRYLMDDSVENQMKQDWEKRMEQKARQAYFDDKGMYPLDSQGLRFDNYYASGDGFLESTGGLIIDLTSPEDSYQGIATRLNLDGPPSYYIAQYVKNPDGEWYPLPLPDKLIERFGFSKLAKDGKTEIFDNLFTADEITNSSWGKSFAVYARDEAKRRAQKHLGATGKDWSKY
tara:strand:+ start:442 stop:3279 length:2838 start_codon:yes stop_codon:yes gene_type:complete